MHRASAHEGNQDAALAMKDLDRAIEMNPNNPEVFVERARAFSADGNYARTIEDASTALRLNRSSSMWIDDFPVASIG